MIAIKDGVRLNPQLAMAVLVMVADQCFTEEGYACILTSGRDGDHQFGSLHFSDLALDFRTTAQGMEEEEITRVASKMRERLGEQYDVVIGRINIHAEFQPKTGG